MRVGIAGIGPPGPPGQALEFKGPWSAITIYDNDDSVQRNGSMWVAVAPSTNVDPATDDGSHWKLAASKGDTGATGAPGLTWQGAWSAATAYVVNDAVSYNGASYRCILNRSATATTPDADATHWAVLAAKGDTGAAGAAGATGATGAPGLTWQGAWSAATAYVVNDAVTYSGSAYRCILNRSATATTPPADPTHWELLASKGDTGAAGSALTIKSKAIGGSYTDITEAELAFKDFSIEVTHEGGTRVLIGGLSPTFESVDDGVYGSSIVAGASHDFSWDPSNTNEYKRGLLITRCKVNRASRIRLYHNSTYRTADVARAIGTDPTGDHGLILELVFTAGMLDLVLSPQVAVLSKALDLALVGNITNTSGADGTVDPKFTAVALR